MALYSEQASFFQFQQGFSFLNSIPLSSGMRVLDLGCGTGELSREIWTKIKRKDAILVGIDADSFRINACKELFKNCEYCGNENLECTHFLFETVDVVLALHKICLKGEYKEFDVVFMNHVVHWISEKYGLFRNLFKMVKNGGIVAIQSPEKDIKVLTRLVKLSPHNDLISKRIYIKSMAKVIEIAVNLGFEALPESKVVSFDVKFDNVEALYNWMIASTHDAFNLNDIDVEKRIQFERDFIQIFNSTITTDVFQLILRKK